MPQFFVKASDIEGTLCTIRGRDVRHIAAVRRVRPGDVIAVRDDSGRAMEARVCRVTPAAIEAEILGSLPARLEPVDITCYLCLLKSGRFDLAVEKTAEAGAFRIVPVISERVVPRPDPSRMSRWARKAEEAAKQCLRPSIPTVGPITEFADVIGMDSERTRIIAHPGSSTKMKEFLRSREPGPVSLLIGPEGGFSISEVSAAEAAGWTPVDFGFTQLRAETAAALLCGIIVYEWSD